ncbi:TMEM175 family protein [Aestuariibaculum sp. M13]|uniref:TMEM175 family protein n=1 Tax=Aestuariibaculum sp. M13 TaxID=2967132 RepID=UPI002159C7DD|nr:TMEM175 family protein [Aestuariibaculum sp. M13]MCR8667426.1 TMEM175 family protein [Aestuariibaculum sp. M13]
MKKERFEAITDAVMAIIITIMALEIELPNFDEEGINEFIMQIGIYILSYAFIAILWINHHNIFRHVKMVDHTTLWLNFLLLFSTSLIPLATRTIDKAYFDNKSHILFALIFGSATLLYFLLDERAIKLSENKRVADTRKMNIIATLLFFLAIPFSYLSIYISSAIFVLVPTAYFLLPRKQIKSVI